MTIIGYEVKDAPKPKPEEDKVKKTESSEVDVLEVKTKKSVSKK